MRSEERVPIMEQEAPQILVDLTDIQASRRCSYLFECDDFVYEILVSIFL